jgi:photosystem II stability/assembly factor-like uncharacterized protein
MKVCKKKIFLITLLIFLAYISNIYSQSSWVSTFFNNTSSFFKIVKRDNLNYLAFGNGSKYFYKSSDAGNNWSSIIEYSIDSIISVFDGQFVNSQTGWIVGQSSQTSNGVIYKTTNGGFNWIMLNTGFDNWICRCLCFINENTGWVGSHHELTGYLLKTTNGGLNWSKQDFPGAYQINSVKFFDVNNGWISTEDSAIYRTSNGGLNWVRKQINNIQPANYINYRHLFPLNNNEIYALIIRTAPDFVYSHVYKTINGGDNWNLMYTYTDSSYTNAHYFYRLNFINLSTGFIYGSINFIIRTTNTGVNWDKVNILIGSSYYPPVYELLPINSNELFVAGGSGGQLNYILKSTNTGLNWSLKSYNWQYNFTKTKFVDNNTGFILADTGRIFKTTNNGENWDLSFNNNNYWFKDISFVNSSTGCIIDFNYSLWSGRILRTTNTGNTWIEVNNSLHSPINTIRFIDQNIGFAGCDSNRLLKTINAGLNWDIINLNGPVKCNFVDLSFIDNLTGWVLAHYDNFSPPSYYERNIIWKTTNSGNNWNIIFDSIGSNYSYNYSLYFIDNNKGYKLSSISNKVQMTTNGGINWFNYTFPYVSFPTCINFINQYTGWVGGKMGNYCGVVKTTNAGNNWFLQFYQYGDFVQSLDAFDSEHAWFCGRYSSIYKTTNGGGNIGIKTISINVPNRFSLSQNYPNPFNPTTNIKFQVASSKFIRIVVYNILGKEVAILVNEKLQAGEYEVQFPNEQSANVQLPSGVYFYSLYSDGVRMDTKKMLMIK